MGRGNVSVLGPYEGLYYIDNDDFHIYRHEDIYGEELETRLLGQLTHGELMDGSWIFDDPSTEEEKRDILEWFVTGFTKMFPSFKRPAEELWLRNGPWGDYSRKVILESGLFFVAIEDNEWSLAVELLQKEDPYDGHLSGLQGRFYKKYLEGVKKCLLERLPSIGIRTGAWTSGSIKASEAS